MAAYGFEDALDFVDRNISHWDRTGEKPKANVIHEIGIALLGVPDTRQLRGPYFDYAYQFGVRSWQRSEETNEWSFEPPGIANPHGIQAPE